MSYEDKIIDTLTKIGAIVTRGWYTVSERPERPPFGKELEYKVEELFWGKIHLRNEGDLYVLVMSKDIFNWKDKISQLKVKGEIEDAAGGLLWLKENLDNLEEDMKYLKEYLSSLKK
ncbi:succinate dehydrogenase [Sulfolobus sp. S-194]|uniref:succinate dehydrogenase n=1 Tax=Sulfolobus sp. S-194 TaxID=2512240 RepID=UPI001436DD5C|nr:succinate dehydrogenase [Sulfolobus sp. S-194]QIW23363.1 succinate dehydrogenase [Sulfolobus sp. S-194]